MAPEATVYVIDLGSTMADCHSGRLESDLDWGMRKIYDKMAESMESTRTTLSTGVVGFRTDGTDNPLGDEGYENISVLQPLGPLTMPKFHDVKVKIKASQSEEGDAISAIVVAIHMIEGFIPKLKTGKLRSAVRKIILLTDGQGVIDEENLGVSCAQSFIPILHT